MAARSCPPALGQTLWSVFFLNNSIRVGKWDYQPDFTGEGTELREVNCDLIRSRRLT